jgi:hypothetical protein
MGRELLWMMGFLSGITVNGQAHETFRHPAWLFFQDTFKPVTNEGTSDKDNHKDDNLDKNSKHSQETDAYAQVFGNEEHRDEHKDNTQNDPDDCTISQDTHEVFFPMMKKAKGYTKDKIQQFKPHPYSPGLSNIARRH